MILWCRAVLRFAGSWAAGITVTGILVGMLAFGAAIVRERIYAQDYSDLEYDAAALGSQEPAR